MTPEPLPERSVARVRQRGPSLLRRLIVFQLKLAVDGLKDLVLSPLSIASVVLGYLFSPGDAAAPFRRVMRLGRRMDAWIDLFGDAEDGSDRDTRERNADGMIDTLEALVREEYERGGGLAGLQDRLGALRRRRRTAGDGASADPASDDRGVEEGASATPESGTPQRESGPR
jgi:hypothetical protein